MEELQFLVTLVVSQEDLDKQIQIILPVDGGIALSFDVGFVTRGLRYIDTNHSSSRRGNCSFL